MAKGAKLAAFHGVPQVVSYQDYDALLAGDAVNAVYITLPNSALPAINSRVISSDDRVRPVRDCHRLVAAGPLSSVKRSLNVPLTGARRFSARPC